MRHWKILNSCRLKRGTPGLFRAIVCTLYAVTRTLPCTPKRCSYRQLVFSPCRGSKPCSLSSKKFRAIRSIGGWLAVPLSPYAVWTLLPATSISLADKDAHRLGDLLLDNLIEPVQSTPDWFCNWFGRAFLHARVEWVGGVDERADTPEVSDFGPTAASRKETVVWHGHQLQVPPLDMQLRASEARGMTDRVEQIKRLLENRSAT